ncbi:DUF2007 domain-containing protein [Roseomonas sp. 18066]|uniref:putative signal transducing protein n=1 Tax=Roseomonas sp. 18066 TaxID=2681412 RepID=UPI00135BCE71|nr:DUF2007 domain-containing protein [Roseomonas sp. 18066]
MRIVAESADPIRLSFLAALLNDAGIPSLQLDVHVSALHGGIGAFPRRLGVATEDHARALAVLRQAGQIKP